MDIGAPPATTSPGKNSKENDVVVDELLKKIKDGFSVRILAFVNRFIFLHSIIFFQVKNAKMSDVLAAYERKILMLEV